MKILLSEEEIRQGVARMAEQVALQNNGRPLTVIGVMTGSVVLLADLIRLLNMPLQVGVLQASSYDGITRKRQVTINAELLPDVSGRRVMLVDDIFDTGHTLANTIKLVRELGAASVHSAVLLVKQGRREVDLEPDFAAFHIPDEFVVGYGLDYRDTYRNLPYIAALEPDDLRDQEA